MPASRFRFLTRLLCAVSLACFAAAGQPALGQDWAKAQLDKSPRHMEFVKVSHDKRDVNCFVVYPEVKDKAPTVIVIHEIFGLSDWVRGVCDQLAAEGYIAIAPDLISGMAEGGGGTDKIGGRDAAMKAVSSLPADQVTADLDAVAKYVATLPAANGKIAVCGFCWGGGQSFRYATNNKDVKAVYSFYGPPPTDEAALKRIDCPVYGFYAANDARIGAMIPAGIENMKKAGKTYEPITYEGAGHGFMRDGEDPSGNAGNKKARDEAWQRWKDLLKKL